MSSDIHVAATEIDTPHGVRLVDLVHESPDTDLATSGAENLRILGVTQDSRLVKPGFLFVARPGAHTSGERFIADAIARGASAILVDRASTAAVEGAARVVTSHVPRALAFAAAAVHGHPTFTLEVVGITGTNGKTTTAHLTARAIEAAGGRPAIFGTLGNKFEGEIATSAHTTQEADALAEVMANVLRRGATHAVMEVSSIALAAHRVEAIRFRVAAFTNLTHDHLDYHGTMEAYAAAKARLFFDLHPGAAAVNVDDPWGADLAERISGLRAGKASVLARYSARPDAPASVEIAPETLSLSPEGIRMKVRTPAGHVQIASPLVGAHNVSNLLAALACAVLCDLDPQKAAAGLSEPIVVDGRLERCDDPRADDVVVLVDYAHTPDALERVLSGVRAFARNADGSAARVLCVFGCGGDRDPKKRPVMGEVAGRLADVAIVTNDNPRSERPEVIADAILPGVLAAGAAPIVELSRSRAILRAVLAAAPGDVVLIAGKGHEPYQIIGDETFAFDDREEARRALATRRISRKGAGQEAERGAHQRPGEAR